MVSSLRAILCLAVVSLIYGTTPLMCLLAMRWLNSASLLVTLKGSITTVFAIASLVYYVCTTCGEEKEIILQNLRSFSTYWKVAVGALLLVLLPFYFGAIGLLFLPPTLFAVFMVSSVWIKVILERILCLKAKTPLTGLKITGTTVGLFGLGLSFFPIVYQSTKRCPQNANSTEPKTLELLQSLTKSPKDLQPYQMSYPYTACYPKSLIGVGAMFFFFSCFAWAASQVFWERHGKTVNRTVKQLGQHSLASCFAFIIWLPLMITGTLEQPTWDYSEGAVAIVFLGFLSGWLASYLVHHLGRIQDSNFGNQYMVLVPIIAFLEDCVFIRDVVTTARWLIALETLGVLCVSLGIYLTNVREHVMRVHPGLLEGFLDDHTTDIMIPHSRTLSESFAAPDDITPTPTLSREFTVYPKN